MSSVNENPVHAAVKALEHAMHATSAHHRRVAEVAAAGRPVPAPAPPAQVPAAVGSGGAA